jgi:hypothetical protein
MTFNYEVYEVADNYEYPMAAKGVVFAVTAMKATEILQNDFEKMLNRPKDQFIVKLWRNETEAV